LHQQRLLQLLHRRHGDLATGLGRRWRGGTTAGSTGGQTASPGPQVQAEDIVGIQDVAQSGHHTGLQQIRGAVVAGITIVAGGVATVVGQTRPYDTHIGIGRQSAVTIAIILAQGGFGVAIAIAISLLLGLLLVVVLAEVAIQAIGPPIARSIEVQNTLVGGGHPLEILAQLSAAALAAAGLVDQLVALLGPQVLEPLPLRPGAGPAVGLEGLQHARLPQLEALAVHVLPCTAVLVVAEHPDAVGQGQFVQRYQGVQFAAVSAGQAAAHHAPNAPGSLHGRHQNA